MSSQRTRCGTFRKLTFDSRKKFTLRGFRGIEIVSFRTIGRRNEKTISLDFPPSPPGNFYRFHIVRKLRMYGWWHGYVFFQILEAVHAWERGEQPTDEVTILGAEVYRLIEDLDESHLVAPEVEEVVTAALWLTNLVGEIPPQTLPDDLLEQGTWCLVDHLAHAQALHQGWGGSDDDPPEEYQHAYAQAMRRFAITIREGITGAQVQAAAQQRGMWPGF